MKKTVSIYSRLIDQINQSIGLNKGGKKNNIDDDR